ncbi:MAG: hypothetical protein N3A54_01475 [Patescibacteria group bacterium]|nr:hypothetical protein [Patescibacteria group bacterium]
MNKELIKKAVKEFRKKNLVEAEHFFKKAIFNVVYEKINQIEKDVLMDINYDFYGYRQLSKIAEEVEASWKSPTKAALEYLKAMKKLNKITESYYEENGKKIVEGFLGAAGSWVGPEASKIKKELKSMLAGIPLSEAGTCPLPPKKKDEDDDEVMEQNKMEDEMPKEKPKKIGKKYLLQDEEEENEEDLFEEAENTIANTDTEKGVFDSLKTRWAAKIEDAAESFDATVVFKGKPFYIRYVGKLGGKFKAKIGTGSGKPTISVEGRDVNELLNNVYKMIVGKKETYTEEVLNEAGPLEDLVKTSNERELLNTLKQKWVPMVKDNSKPFDASLTYKNVPIFIKYQGIVDNEYNVTVSFGAGRWTAGMENVKASNINTLVIKVFNVISKWKNVKEEFPSISFLSDKIDTKKAKKIIKSFGIKAGDEEEPEPKEF